MLLEDKDIPEIFYMKHRNDSDTDFVDYQKSLLTNSLSKYLFNNDIMNNFLIMLQSMVTLFFDQFNVIKNFKNFLVDKYEYKHPN